MVTIDSSPALITAAYSIDGSNLSYVLDSTLKSWAGMKYVGDLWVDGQYVTRIKVSPNTVDLKAVLNVGRVIGDFLSSDILVGASGATQCPNSFASFFVVFGEETDGTPGGTGASYSVALGPTSSVAYAWNAAAQYADPVDYQDYYMPGIGLGGGGRFLTNAPNADRDLLRVQVDEESFLYYLTADPIPAYALTGIVDVVSATGGTYTYAVTGVPVGATYEMQAYAVGPTNLNAAAAAGLVHVGSTSGATVTDPIVSCGDSYSFRVQGFLGAYSERRNFEVSCCDTAYRPFRLMWLNPLGGYDAYTFRMRSTERYEVARQEYQRFLSRYSSGGSGSFGYSIGDRGRSVYSVGITPSYAVVSEWQSAEAHAWVAELFQSPEVYLLDADGPIPVVVTDTSVEVRNKSGFGNRLLSHTVTFQLAYEKIVQRG